MSNEYIPIQDTRGISGYATRPDERQDDADDYMQMLLRVQKLTETQFGGLRLRIKRQTETDRQTVRDGHIETDRDRYTARLIQRDRNRYRETVIQRDIETERHKDEAMTYSTDTQKQLKGEEV